MRPLERGVSTSSRILEQLQPVFLLEYARATNCIFKTSGIQSANGLPRGLEEYATGVRAGGWGHWRGQGAGVGCTCCVGDVVAGGVEGQCCTILLPLAVASLSAAACGGRGPSCRLQSSLACCP